MSSQKKILICYNSPVTIFSVYNGKPLSEGSKVNDLSESGFAKEIETIKASLSNEFFEVKEITINRNIDEAIRKILDYNPDAIFNLVESVEGISSYEYCMTGIYELLGINYTGNTPSTLGNCLNKERTKEILRSFDVTTPQSVTLKPFSKLSSKSFSFNFPFILKLLKEDASIGISEFSVVNSFNELKKQFEFLSGTYKQDIIIEEYIDGRELNVAILGNEALPVSEIDFTGLPSELPKIVTYDGKWMENSVYYNHTKPSCPAKLDKATEKRVVSLALKAFNAMNCRDYARVDIRLSKKNVPFVIEVNPNPDISADSGFARAAAASGISHKELLIRIVNFALDRKKDDTQIQVV
ncbi:MAG: ATP-grasp domain-containing protein [Ignavibacteriaceae bacterium]|nr:ATP-grasp domain-containing protein [Ignavibacteriaceae bacterium]